jgi:hypothetical protein
MPFFNEAELNLVLSGLQLDIVPAQAQALAAKERGL